MAANPIQPTLWEQPPQQAYARRTDPRTSKRAAIAIEPKVGTLERTALEAFRAAAPVRVEEGQVVGGLTIKEMVRATGVPYETISPRVRPLAKKNLIRNTGKTRVNDGGREALVWEAVKP